MTDRSPAAPKDVPWKFGVERRYDAFIERLGVKAKVAAQRHAEQCEADASRGYGEVWKRLAGSLGNLAPWAIEITGQSVKFHIPDGKYRQQVFAMEDSVKGIITLYMPDVLPRAIKDKLLKPHTGHAGDPNSASTYDILAERDRTIDLEVLTADTKDLGFGKGMVGWGKRALRTRISALAPEHEVALVEKLCALAAESWNIPAA